MPQKTESEDPATALPDIAVIEEEKTISEQPGKTKNVKGGFSFSVGKIIGTIWVEHGTNIEGTPLVRIKRFIYSFAVPLLILPVLCSHMWRLALPYLRICLQLVEHFIYLYS